MRSDWHASVEREGLAPAATATAVASAVSPDGEPPCPACGSTAGLDAGACIECGLQLE
jgi:hypothetical protein